METAIEKKVGLFNANYEIGGEMPGAPVVNLNLGVYTPQETVSGIGHISQAVSPPLDIATRINGQYTYMCVMPKNCHILVTATGYPAIKWPSGGGVGPVLLPNFEIRMVLTEDWKSGVANYKYQDAKGNWQEVKNAPVKINEVNLIHEN